MTWKFFLFLVQVLEFSPSACRKIEYHLQTLELMTCEFNLNQPVRHRIS